MVRLFPSFLVMCLGTAVAVSAEAQDPADAPAAAEADAEADAGADAEAEELSDAEYLRERGRHCAGRYNEQWVMHQLFAIQTNPEGAYNQLRVGACFPLIRRPGVLFDYTNVEIGVINELTPAFTQLGGYAQITPLSFLQIRAEGTGLVYWPLPFPRTGYNPTPGYDAGFEPADLPAGSGRVETGWSLNLIASLRGKVAFNRRWGLILLDVLNVSYFEIGGGSYYFNVRWDVIMRSQDWLIGNEVFLGIETRVGEGFAFRYGVFDSYRRVPNAGYDAHQLGLFIMGWWPKPYPAVWDFTPFVRAGVYLDHDFRTETFSVLAGLITQYELGDF